MNWVRVIVVNYNGGDHLAGALAALAAQTMDDFEAVVLDNASSDDSFERAKRTISDPRIRFVEAGANLGFAAGNNRGAQGAATPWLATLNPDAYAEPCWLEALRRATEDHPEVAVFGSTQIDFSDPTRLDGCGDVYGFAGVPWRGGYKQPLAALPPDGETFSACAAAALFRRDAFEAVGGFDESFFCYVEDVDLGYRLRLAGHRCRQVSSARILHVGGASAGVRSNFARFHGVRNNIWTFVMNTPSWLFWLLLPVHLGLNALHLASASRRGFGSVVLRAQVAALAGLPRVWNVRRQTQSRRVVSTFAMARMLDWSPSAMLRQRPGRLSCRCDQKI